MATFESSILLGSLLLARLKEIVMEFQGCALGMGSSPAAPHLAWALRAWALPEFPFSVFWHFLLHLLWIWSHLQLFLSPENSA